MQVEICSLQSSVRSSTDAVVERKIIWVLLVPPPVTAWHKVVSVQYTPRLTNKQQDLQGQGHHIINLVNYWRDFVRGNNLN